MHILAIDTSQEGGYVALFKDKKLIEWTIIAAQKQTDILLEKIDQLLKKCGLDIENIDIFATCTGPGSFTGTRIGVMTAKTLAFAKSKPIIGYTSFVGRNPPIAFIGKKKIAKQSGEDIKYETLSEPTPKPHLDLEAIGNHLENLSPSPISIPYPQI